MQVSYQGVLIGIGILSLLGPVVSVVIRQVIGPRVRVFAVEGMTLHCLSDARGIRVVCDDQVVFATSSGVFVTAGNIDVVKSTKSKISGNEVVVRYRGLLPRLAIFVNGIRVTSWPFAGAEWWARFFAVSWPLLSMISIVALIAIRLYGAVSFPK
jgi:hypothetical protein